MIEILFVVCFVISLGSISAVILITHQLQGDYKSEFLNNYFYYLIAFLAFAFYASWAQIILRNLMRGLEISPMVIERVGHLLPVLGFPFVLIAWLMQIRMMYAIGSQKMSSIYSVLYFGIFLVFFLSVYLFFRVSSMELDSGINFRISVISFVLGLDLLMSLLAIWIGLIAMRSLQDQIKKNIYVRFMFLFALSILIRYILGPLMFIHALFMAGFLLLFFTSFLIPLLYLKSKGDDLFPQQSIDNTEEINMDVFYSKFQISKRESEIVAQICQGKSNKQIAEELFISLQTVKDHTHRIYMKVGINSRMQLLQKVNTGR